MHQAKAAIDFFEYLSREHILSQDVLRELRRVVFESVPQIGRILLDRGVMDVRQVMQIVGQQADSPQVRFGELAVRAGYLSSRWEDPQLAADDGRPRRRFYRVTMAGEAALAEATSGEEDRPLPRSATVLPS